jgi:hypothetical protein
MSVGPSTALLVITAATGSPIDLESHFHGRLKHAIVVETRREVVNEFSTPSHSGVLQILVPFGGVLLQADVVIIWILDFGDVNLEMVAGLGMVFSGHPKSVVHSFDVRNLHRSFKEAIAVLCFAIDVASGPGLRQDWESPHWLSSDTRFQSAWSSAGSGKFVEKIGALFPERWH